MATVILHIDEQRELPEGVAETLCGEGYSLVQTSDPEEAIKLLDERKPALVLMELEFRCCDGPDLIAGIRSRERGDVPVLVLTRAPRQSALHGEAISLGAVDFLSKPASSSELLSAIREAAPLPPTVEAQAAPRQSPKSESAGSSFDAEPLFEVLARLHRRGASGVLLATSGKAQMAIQLRNGSVVAIESKRRRASRDETLDKSESEVALAIARRAEAEIFDAFRWTEGSSRFAEKRRLKPDSMLEISRDTGSLLLAGVLEASSPERARDWLRKRATLYICSSAEDLELSDTAELSPEQVQALTELGGEDTLRDLIDSERFDERLLYGLFVANWIELHTEPLLTLTMVELAPKDELEIELDEPLGLDFGKKFDEEFDETLRGELGDGLSEEAVVTSPSITPPADEPIEEAVVTSPSITLPADEPIEEAVVTSPLITLPADEPIEEAVVTGPSITLPADEPIEEAVVTSPSITLPADELTLPLVRVDPARPVVKKARALPPVRVRPASMPAETPRVEIPTAEKIAEECLGDLTAQVMAGDDFAALGLPLSATDQDVQTAYEQLLTQIPGAEQMGANDELCDQAERIRKRIYAAYVHLKDSEDRRAHVELREEKRRGEEERSRAEQSLEAERWFRKGEDLLKLKKYEKAGEAFGMASHFDPEEGDYLSHLGWALYLANPGDEVVQREAMEHIARGIKRSPSRERSYVYLGRIVQAKGDLKTARKIFKRALTMNPDCGAASQALRLLELQEEQNKGLLSRLLKR